MDIKLWYSKHMRQWRWSLIDPVSGKQETGQQWDLQDEKGDTFVFGWDLIFQYIAKLTQGNYYPDW